MLNQLLNQFSEHSLLPLSPNKYQITPGISFLVYSKIATSFTKITVTTSGAAFPAIIEFHNNDDVGYHALIIAYLSILSKISDVSTFNRAFDVLEKKAIFDNIQ